MTRGPSFKLSSRNQVISQQAVQTKCDFRLRKNELEEATSWPRELDKNVQSICRQRKKQTTKASRSKQLNELKNSIESTCNNSANQENLSTRTKFRLLLAVISLVIYLNSLTCGFVYDDRRAILTNHNVIAGQSSYIRPTQVESIKQWFWRVFVVDDFWGTPLSNAGSHKSYRPLVTLSFKLQHLLVDATLSHYRNFASSFKSNHEQLQQQSNHGFKATHKAHAFAYHSFNLLLHMLVCDLVFQVATLLAASHRNHITQQRQHENLPVVWRPEMGAAKNKEKRRKSNNMETNEITNDEASSLSRVACMTALLFVCHPIHVESVTSLVGRAELMGALFALWSMRNMIDYLRVTRSESLLLIKAALSATFACLSKENCATVLLLNILLAVWLTVEAGANSELALNKNDTAHKRLTRQSRGRRLVWTMGVMFALMGLYSALRMAINSATGTSYWPRFSTLDNPLWQSERQFCLKHGRNQLFSSSSVPLIDLASEMEMNEARHGDGVEEISARLDRLCTNPLVLAQLRQSILMTRLYLPAFALKLLLWPQQLSYDWSLNAIQPIASALEWRFMAAVLLYAVVAAFTLSWLIVRLAWPYFGSNMALMMANVVQRRGASLQVKQTKEEEMNETSDSCDTSSVRSMDTLKSIDSGYVDSADSPRTQTPDSMETGAASNKENNNNNKQATDLNLNFKLKEEHEKAARGGQSIKLTKRVCYKSKGTRRDNWPLHKRQLEQHVVWTNNGSNYLASDQLALAFSLMLVPYLPASNVLMPVGFLVAERTLYLPSFGFCLLVGLLFDHLARWFSNEASKSLKKDQKITSSMGETACFALLMVLLTLGSYKTIERNADWRDEASLFSSNLAQSGAKSMANLATLKEHDLHDGSSIVAVYEQALKLEPHSADLHYNLALAKHRQYVSHRDDRGQRQHHRQAAVEFHYRMALRLRPNFALAALNLAWWQFESGAQLADVRRNLIENCAIKMSADEAKSYDQHVRTQIECLISGARLTLGDYNKIAAAAREPTSTGAVACAKVVLWMRLAREKALQLEQSSGGGGHVGDSSLVQFGDLNKQLAQISWLELRCTDAALASQNKLELDAWRFALASETPIESHIYLDLFKRGKSRDKGQAINLLKRAVARESQKGLAGRRAADVATLLVELARHYAALKHYNQALKLLDEAIEASRLGSSASATANHLTLAAQLAYESNDHVKSERLYSQALETLLLQGAGSTNNFNQTNGVGGKFDNCSKQLASAHANYGAIMEVNKRPRDEIERHYRRALDCDPNNRVAATNLKRISRA